MRGGARPGAGRKKGAPNKAGRVARAKQAKLDGALPHEMLLAIARGEKVNGFDWNQDQQLEAMSKSAPYYAPRFASKVEHTGKDGHPIELDFGSLFAAMSDEQLATIRPVLTAIAQSAPGGPRPSSSRH